MQDTSLSFRAATRNRIIERIKRDGTCFINTLSTRRGLRLVGRSDASFVTLNSIQSRIDGRIARGGMVFNCPSEGDSGSEAGVTHWEYALRAWFAFVHASPPTGVTKKIPCGTLSIPAFPSQIKKFPLTGTFLSSKILFLISFSLKIQGHQVS